jgi:hypothetical protein
MILKNEMIQPTSLDQLEDPEFMRWLNKRFPGPQKPDEEDCDRSVHAATTAEKAHQYRLAQARKLMRLWGAWKAAQN